MKLENDNRKRYFKILKEDKYTKEQSRKIEMDLLSPSSRTLTPREKQLKGKIVLDWDTMLDIEREEKPTRLKG